jgi:hypothetical protein
MQKMLFINPCDSRSDNDDAVHHVPGVTAVRLGDVIKRFTYGYAVKDPG